MPSGKPDLSGVPSEGPPAYGKSSGGPPRALDDPNNRRVPSEGVSISGNFGFLVSITSQRQEGASGPSAVLGRRSFACERRTKP
jgi:hypothetical protein